MSARDEEINELLSMAAKLTEVASRNQLAFARQLLDMLQLELTMIMFGYSDGDDETVAKVKPAKPAGSRPVKRGRRP